MRANEWRCRNDGRGEEREERRQERVAEHCGKRVSLFVLFLSLLWSKPFNESLSSLTLCLFSLVFSACLRERGREEHGVTLSRRARERRGPSLSLFVRSRLLFLLLLRSSSFLLGFQFSTWCRRDTSHPDLFPYLLLLGINTEKKLIRIGFLFQVGGVDITPVWLFFFVFFMCIWNEMSPLSLARTQRHTRKASFVASLRRRTKEGGGEKQRKSVTL
jgi:hypothetical protein